MRPGAGRADHDKEFRPLTATIKVDTAIINQT
jgi:hypothetical protein